MRRVCCGCGTELGRVDSDTASEDVITHGMCEPCAEAHLYDQLGEPLDDFLDRLDVPVLVVESDTTIRMANQLACSLLGRTPADVQEHRPGEVLECKYAQSPNGCGQSICCKTCTIRNAVLDTFATGERITRRPAYPDIYFGDTTKSACLEISTEKVDDVVLLQINDLRHW